MILNYTGTQPQYMSQGAAGADLESEEFYTIHPNEQVMIDTGTSVQIPEGYFGMAAPRSSLCNKKGLQLVNSLGIIDSDFIGSIKLVYKNNSAETVYIEEGERIGQLIILPFVKAVYTKVDKLEDTLRGEGGFGSTGK
jgi:dUTP pyrophosphatase